MGKWFAQILVAVDHCHTRSICHRDITPANILLDDDRSAHLADFGLAFRTTPGTPLTMYCGSKGFIAPEVILGEYVVARDLTMILALTRGEDLVAVQVQRPCGGHVESRLCVAKSDLWRRGMRSKCAAGWCGYASTSTQPALDALLRHSTDDSQHWVRLDGWLVAGHNRRVRSSFYTCAYTC